MGVRAPLIVDDEARGIFRVHRSVFTDPDILAAEQERIFDRCWLYAGHKSEVRAPGDFVTRRVGGRPVIISRGRDEKVRVLLNSCSHRGTMVCREPRGNTKVHRCIYHGWSYTPEGELRGLPGKGAYSEAFDRRDLGLRQPPGGTSVYRDLVFVNFNPGNDVTLEDYLADAKGYIDLVVDQAAARMEVVGGSHSYGVRGNYKLLVENSIDGYHAITTHRRYFDWLFGDGGVPEAMAAYVRAVDESLRLTSNELAAQLRADGELTRFTPKALGNGHSIPGRAVGPWGRPMAQWAPHFGEERKVRFKELYSNAVERLGEERAYRVCMCSGNIQIFPNLVISDIMTTNIRTYHPTEPGYAEVDSWCLGPEEEEPEERALRLDSFVSFLGPGGFATPDDLEVVEACQRGYETIKEAAYSDVSRGMTRSSATDLDELQMRAYWREWARLMNSPTSTAMHEDQRGYAPLRTRQIPTGRKLGATENMNRSQED